MKLEVTFTETENVIDTKVELNESEIGTSAEFERQVVATGTYDHTRLVNRDAEDSHPIKAITGLQKELDDKIESSNVLTNKEIEELLK